MRKLKTTLVVAALVLGALVGFASPGEAVHGCILTNPSAGAPVPDQPNIGPSECSFEITPGGAYNISVVAEAWQVTVTQGSSVTTFSNGTNGNANRVEAVSAAAAENGGTVSASVTNGAMVVGCAACDPPGGDDTLPPLP